MAFRLIQLMVIFQFILVLVDHFSFKFKLLANMALSMNKKKKALKPKMKSLKVRVQRIKADMGKIMEDQKCIRESQRNIGERFGEIKCQCHQPKEETEVVMKQSACNQIRLRLMFDILGARKDGDFDKTAALTRVLNLVSDGTRF